MTMGYEPVDVSPTPWSCVCWPLRPSARRIKSVLGWAIAAAVCIVLFSVWLAQPTIGCTDDPNIEVIQPPRPCVTRPDSELGLEFAIPATPGRVGWGLGIGLVVIAGSSAYLWWPRRASPLAWIEFERGAAVLRAPLAERYGRTQDPEIGHQLEEFDADFIEIQARYGTRRNPPVS